MKHSIRVEKISKLFRLGKSPTGSRNLTETLSEGLRSASRIFRRSPKSEDSRDFWALKDVSFDIEPGEVVGILGRNGAGKSTLLKVLSQIIEPTSGRVEMRGRLGSLLEVGTGFHPELTGRENIYLNGSIIGMKRSEIDAKFAEIVEFAEIGPFLDTPVKRYSSGMYVRLAFAIAAHLQPEILILDEVLAVGDARFQKKCLGKMKDVSSEGRTILFVSHDMAAVRKLCRRGILLSRGCVAMTGPIDKVIAAYLQADGGIACAGTPIDLRTVPRSGGNHSAKFTEVTFNGPNGGPLVSGQSATFRLRIQAGEDRTVDSLSVIVLDAAGNKLINADTVVLGREIQLRTGLNEVVLKLEQLGLWPGSYRLGFWLAKKPATTLDYLESACEVEVVPAEGDAIRPASDGLVRCVYDLVSWGPIHE